MVILSGKATLMIFLQVHVYFSIAIDLLWPLCIEPLWYMLYCFSSRPKAFTLLYYITKSNKHFELNLPYSIRIKEQKVILLFKYELKCFYVLLCILITPSNFVEILFKSPFFNNTSRFSMQSYCPFQVKREIFSTNKLVYTKSNQINVVRNKSYFLIFKTRTCFNSQGWYTYGYM